jgi:4-coumarate--CoA ligase
VSKSKFVLVQPDLIDPVLKASKEVSLPNSKIIIFNPHNQPAPPNFPQWHDLLSHGEADWVGFDDLETSRNSIAALLFSSGTTGLPKATMLSHYNFIAQSTLLYEAPLRPYRASRCFALPMFHAATAPVCHTTPLRMGEKGYILERFDLEKWFWLHQEYGITDIACVPPIVIMAINSPLRHKYSLKATRVASVGAAPLDKQPQGRFQALLNNAPMSQVWGMTETSCVATRLRYPGFDTTGSVGYAIPDLDIKLVDDDGKDISGYDVRGELCVRGPTVVRGYFENPEANARDFDGEGYFHTG